jgi:hypothetical protein
MEIKIIFSMKKFPLAFTCLSSGLLIKAKPVANHENARPNISLVAFAFVTGTAPIYPRRTGYKTDTTSKIVCKAAVTSNKTYYPET